MAVTKLSGDNLRALRPLVLEALDYRQLRGVLADLIEEADPDLAGRLRRLQTYELTLRALDCGRTYESEAAARCRGLVLRYEGLVRKTRVRSLCNSRTHDPFRVSLDFATAERCRLPGCGCAYPEGHWLTVPRCWCVRRAHCLALVWRGLDGEAVPPDVELNLADLRNSIHFTTSRPMR